MLQPQEWKIVMMKSLNGGSSHLQHATTTRMETVVMKSLNGTSSHLESG